MQRLWGEVFSRKNKWIKKSGLCFRCLTAKHRANQCKEKITRDKCTSHLHQTLLHKERETKKQPSTKEIKEREEVRPKCTSICEGNTGGFSCSKIILVDVFTKPNQRSQFTLTLLWMIRATRQ